MKSVGSKKRKCGLTCDLELTFTQQLKGHFLRRAHVEVSQAVLEGYATGRLQQASTASSADSQHSKFDGVHRWKYEVGGNVVEKPFHVSTARGRITASRRAPPGGQVLSELVATAACVSSGV